MKIGITERGDAACDFAWVDKCEKHEVDGAVIITKKLTKEVRDNLLKLYKNGFPLILHATITGYGGSNMEPNVWEYEKSVKALKTLINNGFPISHIVIRIDPMFPGIFGMQWVKKLMYHLQEQGLFETGNGIRFRMSIYDEYPHVRERVKKLNLSPMYNGSFQPSRSMIDHLVASLHDIRETLNALPNTTVPVFETCAEDMLSREYPQEYIQRGCISETDLEIMGFNPEIIRLYKDENKQNRQGCHCLAIKTELLTERKQCPHGCIYCYWKNE